MAHEEKAFFTINNPEELSDALMENKYFKTFDEANSVYVFSKRADWQETKWPDAVVAIEEDGLYFCTHGEDNNKEIKDTILSLIHVYDSNATFEEL